MYACQWHLDIPFGQQAVVLDLLREWSEALADTPHAPRSRGRRLMVGHIGESASHIVHEHLFDTVADWELVLSLSNNGRFRRFAEEIAPFVTPGSQKWIIFKVVE